MSPRLSPQPPTAPSASMVIAETGSCFELITASRCCSYMACATADALHAPDKCTLLQRHRMAGHSSGNRLPTWEAADQAWVA